MRWKALLLDIDGTLCFKGKLIPGADRALAEFRRRGVLVRFSTNIDSRPPESVQAFLVRLGLDVRDGEVFNPPAAALRLMRAEPGKRWHCLVSPEVLQLFRPFVASGCRADHVLVGYWDGTSYRELNQAFRELLGGADLVALQKGGWFFGPEGINLDTGALVAALEYASGRQARVLGKPSADFFTLCLEDLGAGPNEVAVVGDDPATDIAGARAVGAFSVLVRTGKGSAGALPGREAGSNEDSLNPLPDLVVDSVADLLDWM